MNTPDQKPAKVFDFDHIQFKQRGAAYQEFLRNNHDKPISEAEFLAFYRTIGVSKKHHSPSHGRADYRKLRTQFNFFPTP